MENTLENKVKFFAQYWGQEVLIANSENNQKIPFKNTPPWIQHNTDIAWLELKRIDNITDEDARSLAFEDASEFFCEGSVFDMLDELRLLGYAVDWADLGVEEMVDFGWIKYKSE